jgi:4-diphosphocytidyl-2-C-methyl-D-erythritol kinase
MRLIAPAKINLFLRVTGRRPDGYHDLISLLCAVDLYDPIRLDFETTRNRVICPHPAVPKDETNLALRAANLFFDRFGHPGAVAITLDKRIPVAAGLGGGSSNAAAVLWGLNHRYGRPFSRPELMSMGASLGMDVPFFLFGRPALATGRGDRLQPYDGLKPHSVVLVCPALEVSTAAVYKSLNLRLTKCKKRLKSSLFNGRMFDARTDLCNDLETVTLVRYPAVVAARRALAQQNPLGVLMSGSGPAVFGIFDDRQAAGQACRALARARFERVILTTLRIDRLTLRAAEQARGSS